KRALFAGRIMFPIRSNRGDVVAFGGRIMGGDGPKYINSPETEIFHKRMSLYGIDLAQKAIRTKRQVVLCEGYTDVLALHQAGIENAVAALGTALTGEHGAFLQRYCDSALLVFDADEAGARATGRAAGILETHGILCEVAVLDEGVDPADLLRHGGSQALVDAISSPLSALEFLVRSSMNATSAASPEGKEFVLGEVFPYISLMRSEVRRRESLRLAADLIGADREAVLRDFGRYHRTGKTRSDGRVTGAPSDRATNKTTSHDLFLMLATVGSRERFSYVRRWIQPGDLEDPMARDIYVALEEAFRRGESSLELLLERIADPAVVDLVGQRLATGEFEGKHDQAIHDGVLSIRRRALQQKVREVEAKLRRAASGVGEPLNEVELLGEKMYLDRELQKLKGESG
ncbi:MAG: toprim domain-containing protein, partial [Spirochaetaceae bacterium]|nr:toprim domain-containing protein [Spirochaetaceae bacterium]